MSGGVLVVAGVATWAVVAPALVRFPLSTNQTMHYRGTVTLGANLSNLAPLASPVVLPLEVTRTVKVVSGSFGDATVAEAVKLQFAGLTKTETYQYVMDRRSMQLLNAPGSYAFGTPADRMTPAGSYRITMPMGTSSTRSYQAWAPETNSAVTIVPTGPVHRDTLAGTDVVTFTTNLDHQVAPYYLTYLEKGGLPASLSGATVQAVLAAEGVNITQVVQAAAGVMNPAELAALQGDLAQPATVSYSYFQNGHVAVQPQTGVIVEAGSAREGVSARISASGLGAAVSALDPLASNPAVHAFDQAVTTLSAPITVLSLSFQQTPASARSMAAVAAGNARMMNLLQWQLPVLLAVLGVLAVLIGTLWRPRRAEVVALPVRPAAPEHEHELPARRHA